MHAKRKYKSDDDHQIPLLPEFCAPRVIYPTITIPQGNGSFLISAGKPQIIGPEIGARQAAEILGLSVRQTEYLFEIGNFQTAHKPSGKPRGKWLVQRSEVEARKNPLVEILKK